jgi:hypothetical protein
MKNPYALLLMVAVTTAYGQIDNPPTTSSIGLGPTNDVSFSRLSLSNGATNNLAITLGSTNRGFFATSGPERITTTVAGVSAFSVYSSSIETGAGVSASFLTNVSVEGTLTVGSLTATGEATLNGVNNIAPSQTADSASHLMTRQLSDDRYLGEMWNASRMAGYNTTNPSVTLFKGEPMVTYTNGQLSGPFMTEFIDPEKYAGKTVKVLAYCRVDSTNGGNVQGLGRIQYLTNTAGGSDPNFPLSPGGATHGTIGIFTNVNTDVFPVATSTNQYLIFTSNVGAIPTNAKMILASFGFNRASTNTTFTNNLYMHAVQVVVE